MNSAWFLAVGSLWIFSSIDFNLADVTARTRVENEPFSFFGICSRFSNVTELILKPRTVL